MQDMCISPIEIIERYGSFIHKRVVPCGRCVECIKKKQNEFVVRTYIEVLQRGSFCFFTLTYNDEHLPNVVIDDSGEVVGTLRRADVKKMFHDVRQSVSRSGVVLPNFAWFYNGEYGPRTNRPHYHGCFIGLSPEYVKYFSDYWTKHFGFALFKEINVLDTKSVSCVSRYIAKYVTKPQEFEYKYVLDGLVEKPRKVCSKGYGFPLDKERFIKYHLCGLNDLGYDDKVPP